jgi:hypothetical protein
VARPDVAVTGGGVTTVNAELRVSTVRETITVTGATAIVDTQTSTTREIVLDSEAVQACSRYVQSARAALPTRGDRETNAR